MPNSVKDTCGGPCSGAASVGGNVRSRGPDVCGEAAVAVNSVPVDGAWWIYHAAGS